MKTIYFNDYNILPESFKDLNWNCAGGFCFDEYGNVCVVYEKEKGYWTLPGGGKEGDENPEETFKREVIEEAQAEAYNIKYFHCVFPKTFDENDEEILDLQSPIGFRYICKLKNIQDFVPNKGGFEIDERKFVSLEDLPNYLPWLKDSENGVESLAKLKETI